MKIILTLLLISGLSNLANAAVDGRWHGWAYWKYQGEGTKCAAQMIFNEDTKSFSMLYGNLDCDLVVMDVPERKFQKLKGKLLDSGIVVGSYTDNSFEWFERYNERTTIHVSIKVNGTNMDYVEKWIQDESTLLYEITGRLFRRAEK